MGTPNPEDLIYLAGISFERELFDDEIMKVFIEEMFILEPVNRHIVFVDDDIADRDNFIGEYLLSHRGNIRTQLASELTTEYIVIPIKINGPQDLASRNLETEHRVDKYIQSVIKDHSDNGDDPEDMATSPFFGPVTYTHTDQILQAVYKEESGEDRTVAFIAKIFTALLLIVSVASIATGVGVAFSAVSSGAKRLSRLSRTVKAVTKPSILKAGVRITDATTDVVRYTDDIATFTSKLSGDKLKLQEAIIEFGEISTEAADARRVVSEGTALIDDTTASLNRADDARRAAESARRRLQGLQDLGDSVGELPAVPARQAKTVTLPKKPKTSFSGLTGPRSKTPSGTTTVVLDTPAGVQKPPTSVKKGPERPSVDRALETTGVKVPEKGDLPPATTPTPKDTDMSLKRGLIGDPPPKKPVDPPTNPVDDDTLIFVREGVANYDKTMKAAVENLKTFYFEKRNLFQPVNTQTATVKGFYDRLVDLKRQLSNTTDTTQRLKIREEMMRETQLLASKLKKPPFNVNLLDVKRLELKNIPKKTPK